MKLSAHIHEGLLNLFSSKLRSMLALLGILVGTTAVVAMVSGGKLATNESLKQFKSLGTDLLALSIKDARDTDTHEDVASNLTLSQANGLLKTNKDIQLVAPYTQVNAPIQFNSHIVNGNIVGITAEFGDIAHLELASGRFISNLDGYNLYCVIGNAIYEQIKQDTLENPIGKQIQLGKNIFTIIGIIKTWPESNFIYTNMNDSIMIPINASIQQNSYTTINNIIMRLNPEANIDNVKTSIENYLLTLLPKNIFSFQSAKELLAHMAKQSEILTVFLGLIGSISLLVGGIGVMNIMLVSVVERQREIGIRRAVGATRADIRYLFLVEALMLSLLGGGLGAVFGILIAYIIAIFWHWTFTLFLLPPVIGFSVSAATGIFFGFYPAHKASRLDPIESLRSV